MRLTQAPIEVLERFVTNVRLTQAVVEVLERFNTNVRVTQAAVEVMYSNPDYVPLPPPPPFTTVTPVCEPDARAVLEEQPAKGVLRLENPGQGLALPTAPAQGSS